MQRDDFLSVCIFLFNVSILIICQYLRIYGQFVLVFLEIQRDDFLPVCLFFCLFVFFCSMSYFSLFVNIFTSMDSLSLCSSKYKETIFCLSVCFFVSLYFSAQCLTFPYLSISSHLWTVCPCFLLNKTRRFSVWLSVCLFVCLYFSV